jgi:hypothetical protein
MKSLFVASPDEIECALSFFVLVIISIASISYLNGCTQTPPTPSSSSTSSFTTTSISKTDPDQITLDTKSWKQETSVKGLIFSYPPELIYNGGGDTDTWSSGSILNSSTQKEYARLTDFALIKCKYTDPSKCNIGTTISATPAEVYKDLLTEYKTNTSFNYQGTVAVGNTKGEKFATNLSKGNVRTLILFYSSSGVYALEETKALDTDDQFFNLLLSTIKVK